MLRELAKKESYIVIGRCADFVLQYETRLVRVFICADKMDRITTEAERLSISKNQAEKRIEKVDKKRDEHYAYFTKKNRMDMTNYDICLNTSTLSYEQCAALIVDYMKKKELL